MLVWGELSVLAIAGFALTLLLHSKKSELGDAWKLGMFLAAFDWVFETGGALLGLWVSNNSIFPLWLVPAEVSFIAVLVGTAYRMVVPKKLEWQKALLMTTSISIIGAMTERFLISLGTITYLNWNSFFALIAYFIAFWIVNQVDARI